jgi:exodeoxyribonuclease V alpha subunit
VQYEEPLIAKSGDQADFRLPDFTVHYQGRTWYWEHLGMLNKASYLTDWAEKKRWYRNNHYWEQVITSKDHPGGLGGIVYVDEIRRNARERILPGCLSTRHP